VAQLVDTEGGLDLAHPDSWTGTEESRFREWYRFMKGATLPGHDLWIELRPDVLKRYRQYAVTMSRSESEFPKIGVLCYLHNYAIVGFEGGIRYQITNARKRGRAQKDDVVSTLALAFLESGPRGTGAVAAAAREQLLEYEDPEPSAWPEGWAFEPEAFRTGLDFSTPDLSDAELRLLTQWYERVCGEVPAYVRFLARHRPDVLKAWRNRFEFAVKRSLPKQMVPLIQLQWEVFRSRGPGIREAALLARGLGVDRSFAQNAVARGMLYGGPTAATVVEEAAGDVFDDWPRADAAAVTSSAAVR
jgi:hypothetical protein